MNIFDFNFVDSLDGESVLFKNNIKFKHLKAKKILWIRTASRDRSLHKMADQEVMQLLRQRNYEVYTTTTNSKKQYLNKIPYSNQIIRIPLKKIPLILPLMRGLLFLFLMPIFFITKKFDYLVIVPDVSIFSLIPTFIFSKINKVKFILDIRSTPVESFGFKGFMLRLWFVSSVGLARRFFDGLTIITPSMKKQICDQFKIDSKKVGVWTSGVSLDLFNPSIYEFERLSFRNKLGLSDRFVVFYHGAFTATRGLMETVKAIKLLKNNYPKILLFLLGDGPTTSDIRNFVAKEGLEDNVLLHGPVEQTKVPKFINLADVCISPLPNHPYWRYQSPLKILEYLAMEKVIIVTDIIAHRSIIAENDCGIYMSSNLPPDIAKKIEFSYKNSNNLGKWGKNGRKIVQENYTWNKVTSNLENFLLSL